MFVVTEQTDALGHGLTHGLDMFLRFNLWKCWWSRGKRTVTAKTQFWIAIHRHGGDHCPVFDMLRKWGMTILALHGRMLSARVFFGDVRVAFGACVTIS